MKNKKLISLICALSMIISIFSAITVNAEDQKGMTLDSSLSQDGKTITINATAVGITAIDNFGVEINIPSAGNLLVSTTDQTGNGIALTNGKLVTITIALKEALAEDFTFTLQNKSAIKELNAASYKISNGTLEAASTTVNKWIDPSAPTPKPTSPARPTIAPVPTENPDQTPVPTDVPSGEKGINLKSSIDSTNKVITIDAIAAGITAIDNFGVEINIPEGVTKDDITVSPNYGTNITGAGNFLVSTTDQTGNGIALTDGKLVTITINLKNALEEPYAFTLQSKSAIKELNADSYKISNGTLVAASTVVTPSTEPVPTVNPVKTVALKSVVSTGYGDAIKAAKDAGKDVYLTVDVKKGDQDAVYGEDYEAVYNGKTLTEAEYKNLISGYTDADMADVINGLTYNIYNSSVNNVSTTVNAIDAEGNAEQIVDPKDNTLTPAKPTAKPSEPSISVKASSTTVEFDKKFTVTATVKNAKDGAKVAFTTNDDEKYAVIFGTPTEINSKGETKATYVANDKAGTVTITATYTDTEGNEKSASVKVTVKKASTTTGGNDGTTSGGGPSIIAPGHTGAVTTPNTNTNYKPDFQDLDSVEWARTAINGLAMRGMISGRDQYTFDPNANITRAEYCQILMGAINALNAKGESTFSDVPSTAWYYNAVSVASQLGIVSGYGDGNFGPNDLITRQDMALMTYKTAKIMNKSLEPVNAEITFEDSHEISDYAFEAVMTLQKAGIINGMTDTTFEPHSNATRAQSAKVIFDTFVDAQ